MADRVDDGRVSRRKRATEEIAGRLDEFASSGKTRLEFCREAGIGKSTLDRWIHQRGAKNPLVRVKLRPAPEPTGGFVVVLGNGRRIESGWKFTEHDLSRLIRVVETV